MVDGGEGKKMYPLRPCKVCAAQCTVCAAQCTVCAAQYVLHSVHCVLHSVHCVLHIRSEVRRETIINSVLFCFQEVLF